MPVEIVEEADPDAVPLTTISVLDYGTDDEYDDAATFQTPTSAESDSESNQPTASHEPCSKTVELLSQLVDPEELPVPNSSTQFEHVWGNMLKGNPKVCLYHSDHPLTDAQGRALYLKKIGASGIQELFKVTTLIGIGVC